MCWGIVSGIGRNVVFEILQISLCQQGKFKAFVPKRYQRYYWFEKFKLGLLEQKI